MKYLDYSHLSGLVHQWVLSPDTAIAGLYAGDNVGDTALKESVVSVAEEMNLNYGVQYAGFRKLGFTYYPRVRGMLVGGGAIGQNGLIEFLAKRYASNPEQVVFHGVDFAPPHRLSMGSKTFLAQVGKISCRSTVQADRLANALSRSVSYAPDNAFCHPALVEIDSVSRQDRTLGINVVPFSKVGILPGAEEKKDRVANAYREIVRQATSACIDEGIAVTHFPFTPADEQFAADIFADLKVTLKPFQNSPTHRIRQIAQMERFIATRLHSHIFAILAQTPFLSISYAGKCKLLQEDLSIPVDSRIRKTDLLRHRHQSISKLVDGDYFRLRRDHFNGLRKKCHRNLKDSFRLLQS